MIVGPIIQLQQLRLCDVGGETEGQTRRSMVQNREPRTTPAHMCTAESGARAGQWSKESFQQMELKQSNIHRRNNEPQPRSHTWYQRELKMDRPWVKA